MNLKSITEAICKTDTISAKIITAKMSGLLGWFMIV